MGHDMYSIHGSIKPDGSSDPKQHFKGRLLFREIALFSGAMSFNHKIPVIILVIIRSMLPYLCRNL